MTTLERFPSSFPRKAYANPAATLREVRPVDLDATLPVLPRPARSAEVLPMRCLCCQGPVQKATAPVNVQRNGYRLSWKAVPAWVCSRCGSTYFEPQEVQQVRNALRAVQGLGK